MMNSQRWIGRLVLAASGGVTSGAVAAGSPVLAHDNRFNRWVAGEQAAYFSDEFDCDTIITDLLDAPERLEVMSRASRDQFQRRFTWVRVLGEYERLLEAWL